ncbi:MAG: C-GCAxxG-C-C family protein [Clostridiaceae bacterium]|nr:C-GCAxxG-C-C family protein [Clostridiaceae bacterium]
MSERSERAVAEHGRGFNCAQSVLRMFCEDYGLNARDAAALACGLGGGARCGELCGAASGAVLAIGLRYGQREAEDQEGKRHCAEETKRFLEAFQERCGALRCADLLGKLYGERTPAQEQQRGVLCGGFIRMAVELLEEMGY